MIISESWLREWVSPDITTQTIADTLTMAGLEVDSVQYLGDSFSGVVVGEIVDIAPHPDADKLKVCQVMGHENSPIQVVCGAPNAREGIKVPFATVGAKLPNDIKIKKAKLRGVQSLGMLCGAVELGFEAVDDGLWELNADAEVGQSLIDYLALNDALIDVDLTPNRSDCLSILGIAHELGALTESNVSKINIEPLAYDIQHSPTVNIEATTACPRYCAQIFSELLQQAETPLWLSERLRRSGLAVRHPVVDITNYVMLELGQPMHAFDADKVTGGITVRFARSGEDIHLLNDQLVKLDERSLIIADESGPIALAGIMGGKSTAVSDDTKRIILESAYFAPEFIAGKARQFGLHTDSSHRFERGVDYNLPEQALARAGRLISEVCGAKVGPICAQTTRALPSPMTVELHFENVERQLGCRISASLCQSILERLQFSVLKRDDKMISLSVPSSRFDITIEADLIEEIARVYGYNNIPSKPLPANLTVPEHQESVKSLLSIKQLLVAKGYSEVITYSFVDPEIQALISPNEHAVDVLNPISNDLSQMRMSLLPGLLTSALHNIKRQQSRVALFESGLTFVVKSGKLLQNPTVAGLLYGARFNESWNLPKDDIDFYDIKAHVESLFSEDVLNFEVFQHPALHPGQSAAIIKGSKMIGVLGALHPSLVKALGLIKVPYVFELDQAQLLNRDLARASVVPKFPEVRRDVAVVIDQSIPVGDLIERLKSSVGSELVNVNVFDIYQGKGVDPERKSVALGLTFQDKTRTLTEEEINTLLNQCIDLLKSSFSADLR